MIKRMNTATRQRRCGRLPGLLGVLFACLIALCPKAPAQPSLTLSSGTAEAGASVALTLSLENVGEDIAGVHFEFTVPDSITFDGASAGTGLSGFASDAYTYTADGATRGGFIAYTASSVVSGDQSLASLMFSVDASAPSGTNAIAFSASWLSNVPGTAIVAHSTGNGSITVGAGGEGEGEGEGEGDSLAEIAQDLFDRFAAADTNNDNFLSFEEAAAIRTTLTQAQFDAIDRDGDGQITMQELLDAGAVAIPVGPSCCPEARAFKFSDIQHYLGDLVLLGMALGALAAMGALSRKP